MRKDVREKLGILEEGGRVKLDVDNDERVMMLEGTKIYKEAFRDVVDDDVQLSKNQRRKENKKRKEQERLKKEHEERSREQAEIREKNRIKKKEEKKESDERMKPSARQKQKEEEKIKKKMDALRVNQPKLVLTKGQKLAGIRLEDFL
jgi:type IV secretory pathway VirB10-like protein